MQFLLTINAHNLELRTAQESDGFASFVQFDPPHNPISGDRPDLSPFHIVAEALVDDRSTFPDLLGQLPRSLNCGKILG